MNSSLHRFHLKIDKQLLKKIDKYRIDFKLKNRDEVVNRIFSDFLPIIESSIRDSNTSDLSDNNKNFSEDIIIKIKEEYFSVIRFVKFIFKTFSYATILRKILRLFLIDKNELKKKRKYLKEIGNTVLRFFKNEGEKTHMKNLTSFIIYLNKTYTPMLFLSPP